MTAILAAPFASYSKRPAIVKGVSASSAGGTTLSATLPSGIVAGDIIIIILAIAAGTSRTFTTPTGYTDLRNTTAGGNLRRVGILKRTADGSEGSFVSIAISGTGSPGVSALAALIGGASSGPEISASGSSGSSTSPNPPSLAPSVAGNYLWIAVEAHQHVNPASAGPSGYSNLVTSSISATENSSVGMAFRTYSGSSEDPGAFTIPNSSQWFADTIAIL